MNYTHLHVEAGVRYWEDGTAMKGVTAQFGGKEEMVNELFRRMVENENRKGKE